MIAAAYVLGGAATGKSTFTRDLLDKMGASLGPMIDLHYKLLKRGGVDHRIYVRGHNITSQGWPGGLYLGQMREVHPGTDGLDKVCSPAATEWLNSKPDYRYLIAEGERLSSERFQVALSEQTKLLLILLEADPMITDLRCLQRGTTQAANFIAGSVTRAEGAYQRGLGLGATGLRIDSTDIDQWKRGLRKAMIHVSQGV